jgi:hypothetical protein
VLAVALATATLATTAARTPKIASDFLGNFLTLVASSSCMNRGVCSRPILLS